MSVTFTKREADVIVVGSGPGGATVARQLARAGKKVMLLERGKDHRGKFYYGTHLGCLLYCDKMGLLMTKEGLNIIRPLMLGGATNLYCGCASKPPAWLKEKYKVDIEDQVNETVEELKIAPLPDHLLGSASKRVMEAASELGYDFEPQPKFMDPARTQFDCGAKCMLGCRCGAKWSASEFVDDAVAAGCELITQAKVTDVIIDHRQAVGVRGKLRGKDPFEIHADTVVLSAGGIGSPIILQHSGLFDAGKGMTMDPTVMVYGVAKYRGNSCDPPMSISWCDDENGYMLSTLIDPWLLYPMIMSLKGPKYPFTAIHYRNTLGIMIKVKDDIAGGITMEGKISKPMTERDQQKLNHASIVCRKILMKAGCDSDSIFVTPLRGTHPSGTVRIGEMLDTDLQTEVKGLYVCDASTFPEALDRPTVLTIVGLGKRLADHILSKKAPKQKAKAAK
ncbi:MAG: GMC family oxidoreductase [Candidatus Abyssubacteria bacterium]